MTVADDPDLPGRLFALIPDGLWLFDDAGTTLWANARMAELLDRSPDEMVGLSAFEMFDQQGRDDFRGHLADMVASGEPRDNVDAYFIRPDGSALWGLVSYTPVVEDGHRVGWLHRVTPYTERKELLDTLAAREQQLATAQRIAHLGSWSWDIEADLVVWSDELCRIYGVAPGTTSTYADYVQRLHPDDRPQSDRTIQDAADISDEYSFDHRILREFLRFFTSGMRTNLRLKG